jgi:hypothetical protein
MKEQIRRSLGATLLLVGLTTSLALAGCGEQGGDAAKSESVPTDAKAELQSKMGSVTGPPGVAPAPAPK